MIQNVTLKASVDAPLAEKRLDVILAILFPDYSRARWQTWIRQGYVKVAQHPVTQPKEKIPLGSDIEVNAWLEEETSWRPEDIAMTPLFVDEHLIVVNKPAGLVVHPAAGNYDGTLVNALLHHYPELSQLPRAGIVHRLDKDTTGIMVVARSLIAHHALVKQLQERTMRREYSAIVKGTPVSGGVVEAPIGRHPHQRIKMAVVANGKPAKTFYTIAERFHHYTLLDLKLESGRTHQIRVHMAYKGYPLVGDRVYAGRPVIPKNVSLQFIEKIKQFNRQALHAKRLTLSHPVSQEILQWETPLPQDMQDLLQVLREEDNYVT